MSNPTSPRVNESDDMVSCYLQHLGTLPRLSAEEEHFYTDVFYQARRDLGLALSHFPRLLIQQIARVKCNEIHESGQEESRDIEDRRRRIKIFIEALRRIAEHLESIRDAAESAPKRELLCQSLERLVGKYIFPDRFYQDTVDTLEHWTTGKESVKEGVCSLPEAEARARVGKIKQLRTKMNQVRTTLVESNLRLVVSVARKYAYSGSPFSDVIQEGNLGLMQAVDRYDPQRGYRFSTYAVWWIRQAITSSLASHSRTIRIPANMAQALQKIKRAELELLQEVGGEPDADAIAEKVGMEPERVRALRKMERQTISLQSTIDGEDKHTLNEVLTDSALPSPDEAAAVKMMSEAIENVLDTLTERERTIIIFRFGLYDQPVQTLEELSGRFSLTNERIRQIEAIALNKLRHPSRKKYLDGYLK